MATVVKYIPGVNEEQIVELCDAIEAAYERAEAHRQVWEAKTAPKLGRKDWQESGRARVARLEARVGNPGNDLEELRRAALDHAGRP